MSVSCFYLLFRTDHCLRRGMLPGPSPWVHLWVLQCDGIWFWDCEVPQGGERSVSAVPHLGKKTKHFEATQTVTLIFFPLSPVSSSAGWVTSTPPSRDNSLCWRGENTHSVMPSGAATPITLRGWPPSGLLPVLWVQLIPYLCPLFFWLFKMTDLTERYTLTAEPQRVPHDYLWAWELPGPKGRAERWLPLPSGHGLVQQWSWLPQDPFWSVSNPNLLAHFSVSYFSPLFHQTFTTKIFCNSSLQLPFLCVTTQQICVLPVSWLSWIPVYYGVWSSLWGV